MLRKHFDDFVPGDAVVQVVAQFLCEPIEGLPLTRVPRLIEDAGDSVDVCAGNLGDVLRPVLPVVAVANLLDELRVDGVFDLTNLELHLLLLGLRAEVLGSTNRIPAPRGSLRSLLLAFGRPSALRNLVGNCNDLHLREVLRLKLELVDHRIEAIVVRPQSLKHLPDDLVRLIVVQRIVGLDSRRDDNGEDDVPSFLTAVGRLPHHAPDRLHDVNLRFARREKENCVKSGYIDAFGQATHVAQDAAGILGRLRLQPANLRLLLRGVHAAVYVLGLAPQCRGRCGVAVCWLALLVGFDHSLEHVGDVLRADLVDLRSRRALNDLAKRNRPLHRSMVVRDSFLESLL